VTLYDSRLNTPHSTFLDNCRRQQVPLVSVKSIRQNDSTAFFYIPRHIELILREIITNSLKATIRSNVGGGNEEICGDRIVEVSISLGKDGEFK